MGGMERAVAAVTGLLFVVTIIGGGLLSSDKPMPTIVSLLHQVTPLLTLLGTAVTLYLLFGREA